MATAGLDFGSVAAGSSKTMTVTATNSGTSAITVSSASVSTKYFSLLSPSLPITVSPGQSTTISIAFTPNAAGAFSATLSVASNASNPTVNVALSGTGTAASVGQLALNPTSEAFGSVAVGSTQAQTVTLTNTGSAAVNISQASVSGAGFQMNGITTPLTLNASQSTTFTVTFAPQASGSASGAVTIASNASNPTLTMALSGTGITVGVLGSNPASLSFGSVIVGNSQALSETVTNSGGSSVMISQVGISGSGFTLSGITAPVTLAAGQSASFTVTFTASSTGAASGNVTITSNASNPTLTVPLSATGIAVGALGSSPSSLSFGNTEVGSTQSLSEKITNTGGSSVTISKLGISAGFSLSGITAPITLTAGQSASFTVSFTPTSAGAATGNVTITSNASNPTLAIPLSGTGILPGTLGANPTSLSFGSVIVGNNQALSEKVTNTGGSSVTISEVAISGTGFTLSGITAPVTLTAGQSASFTVTFTPTAAGAATGNVTVTSNGSNPTLTIPLSGTGTAVGAVGSNPTSLTFGSVTVGSNQSLSEKITNTGGSSVTISKVAISGTGFSLSGITAPVTLTAGQSASFTVTFSPTSAVAESGDVTITSNGSNPTLAVPLSGTGVAAVGSLSVSPTTLAIGSVVVGTSGTASGSLTASGASVVVTAATANNSAFSVGGLSLPTTIPAGQSVPFTVTFSPSTTGAATATLTFTSNAQPSTTTEALTGTGTAAPTHSVSLSWTASTSPDISGYNIYRAVYTTSCGSFSKINPVLNTTTVYTDSTVTDGTNYCYAATTVDSSNEESGYSNIVSDVQIPPP